MVLDALTLFVCDAIVTAFVFAALLFYQTHHKTYPGFRFWVIASLFATIGHFALVFRGTISTEVSIITVGLGFVLTSICRLDGTLRLVRGESLRRIHYLSPLLVAAIMAYFYFVTDNIAARTLVLSTGVTAYAWRTAWVFHRPSNPGNRVLYHAAGILNVVIGIVILLRAISWIFDPETPMFESTLVIHIYTLYLLTFEVGMGLTIVMINNKLMEEELLKTQGALESSIHELKQASSELKTLRGLLPICSWCKSIRDDQGYWNRIETYIVNHSDATLTHGLCPDCALKHFSHTAEKDDSN